MTAVWILGPVTLARGGSPVDLTAPMQRALVAYLALARDYTASRDQIVDALWASAPRSARNLVQQYVAGLRRRLGAEIILTTPHGYRLRPSEGVDADTFAMLLEKVEAARRDGNLELGRDLVDRALALDRGDTLAGLPDCPFVAPARARLEQQLRRARLLSVSLALDAGEAAGVVADAETLATDFPLDEEPAVLLMRALANAGRAGDALAAYERIRLQLADELGVEPGERLREAQTAVLRQDPAFLHDPPETAPWGATVDTVPTTSTELVGRVVELELINKLLCREGVRLVTIFGPGGVGKTRFAVEFATRIASEGRQVAYVPLEGVSTAEEVWQAVAEALRVKPVAGVELISQLARALRLRRPLLVIDNFEHVIAASAELARLMTITPPSVQILVTSRETLHVSGEHIFTLLPLETKANVEGAAPAAQLFCQRAEAAGRSVKRDELADVDEICGRLDGLPLAIDLAAARSTLLPPAALLARLKESRSDVLTSHRREASQRQHSLQECLAWSVGLLSAEERRALCCIALFQGTSSVEDVEDVIGVTVGQPHVLDLIQALVDKSLIAIIDARGEPRVRMLHVIREYCLELLRSNSDKEMARSAHALRYAQKIAKTNIVPWPPRSAREFAAYRMDLPNARVAIATLLDTSHNERAAELLQGVLPALLLLGSYDEADRWLQQFETLGDLSPDRTMDLLYYSGFVASLQGRRSSALKKFDRAFELLATYPDDVRELGIYAARAFVAQEVGDQALARECVARAIAAARRTGDPEEIAFAHTYLTGDSPEDVQKKLRAALRVAREWSNEYLEVGILAALSETALCADDLVVVAESVSWGRRAFEISMSFGDEYGAACGAGNAGAALLLLGSEEDALGQIQVSLRLSVQVQNQTLMVENLVRLAAALATLDSPRAEALYHYWEQLRTAYGFPITPSNQRLIDRFLSWVEPRLEEAANPNVSEAVLAAAVSLALSKPVGTALIDSARDDYAAAADDGRPPQ